MEWVEKIMKQAEELGRRKLTRRQRYILKWNGPDAVLRYKRFRAGCRSRMGHGTPDERVAATAFECRFRGFFPATVDELYRRAGA